MAYELLKVQQRHDGQVVELALAPGPANILSAALMGEIREELQRLGQAAGKDCKLIVFKGEGKHFSYGASVEEHTADRVPDMLPRFHGLIDAVLGCDIPTLARVSGLCLGGSFELAMACSLVFCSEDASFGVPEIQLGVFPPVACVLLPDVIGAPVANDMVLTGRQYPASELQRLGLVNQVVPVPSLDEELEAFVTKHILSKSASSLRLANRAARAALAASYRERIATLERLYLDELMSTDDANEGIQSFLDKRRPVWRNG